MIITTTPQIDGFKIIEYKGLVFSSVVIGVNFLSEAIASFTDFFGGNSGQYRQKLEDMYSAITRDLENKALSRNANAIVSVRIDFEEITGKNMAMLMATATGTAVQIEEDRYLTLRHLHDLKQFLADGIITQEEYDFEKSKIEQSHTNIVAKESAMRQAAIEAEKAMIAEHEEKIRQALMHKKEVLEKIGCNADKIVNLSSEEVESADYNNLKFDESSSMDEIIKQFVMDGYIAEAAKYYVDQTGLDFDDAKSYIQFIIEKA